MSGIIPGRPDLQYSLSFSHKYPHPGWLHAQSFSVESMVTIAVEEPNDGEDFLLFLRSYFGLCCVSGGHSKKKTKQKNHKATKEEHIGTPDILVMSVSEPKRRVHTFPFIILI